MPDSVIPVAAPVPERLPSPAHGAFFCSYLWDSVTLLSDGRITCGFDDPFGRHAYGNVRDSTVREIFHSPAMRALRHKLLSGSRCETCHLYSRVADAAPQGVPEIPPLPQRLVVETTIRCQLRCRNTSCDLNNDRGFKVREEPFLAFDTFCKVIDEIGAGLGVLYFFNYGEAFLNPRALDMLAYARRANPRLHVATSTNGLQIARGDAARRIVEERLVDAMGFTIAGCDDATYQIYHKGGSFEQATLGMRRILEERRRLGVDTPRVHWRYLLFNWNDSDEHIARARRLAAEIGVDEFRFFICSAPLEGRTRRRAPGTPGFEAIRDAVAYELHYVADPFGDLGMYPPEHDDALGTFCWTSRRATLPVRPRGGRAHVALCRKGEAAALAAPVTLRTPWEEKTVTVGDAGTWRRIELAVPAAAADSPFTLDIDMDEIFIAYRHRRGEDLRELGVMVSLDFADGPALSDTAWAPMRSGEPSARAVARPGTRGALKDGLESLAPAWRVRQLYRDILGREGDDDGVEYWVTRMQEAGIAAVAHGLLASDEVERNIARPVRVALATSALPPYATVRACIDRHCAGESLEAVAFAACARGEFVLSHGDLDDARFARSLHAQLLGRAAGTDAAPAIVARHAWLAALCASAEHARHASNRTFIVLAYVTLLRRMPEPPAYQYWLDQLEGGAPRERLLEAVFQAPEYLERFEVCCA